MSVWAGVPGRAVVFILVAPSFLAMSAALLRLLCAVLWPIMLIESLFKVFCAVSTDS